MNQQLDIKRYLNAIYRGWWIILFLAIVTGAVIYFATPESPANFVSLATLEFEDPSQQSNISLPNFFPATAPNLRSQVQALKSPEVLRLAATKILEAEGKDANGAELGILVSDLIANVEARQLQNQNIVQLSAKAFTANDAVNRANAVATAFIEKSAEDQAKGISNRLDAISRQLTSLQDAQNQAYTIDQQTMLQIGDQISSVEVDISIILDQVDALEQSGHATTTISNTIQVVLDDLAVVAGNLESANLLLGQGYDEKLRDSGSDTASAITTGLIFASDSIERSASQLDAIILEVEPAQAARTSSLVVQLEDDLSNVTRLLGQAAISLDDVEDRLSPQTSQSRTASDSVSEAAATLNSSARLVNSVLRSQSSTVNSGLLQVSHDQLSRLEKDTQKFVSQIRALSVGQEASSEVEKRELIINQLDSVRSALGVVIFDIRSLRSQETNTLNIGSLFTAETRAQEASNAITNAVTEIRAIGQTSSTAVSISSSEEIIAQLADIQSGIEELIPEISQVELLDPVEEQEKLELIGKVTSLQASLNITVLQIQALRVADSDAGNFVPLFVAEKWSDDALGELTSILGALISTGVSPSQSSSINSLVKLRDELNALSSDISEVSLIYGGVLTRGALTDELQTSMVDELSQHNASLELILQQLPALRIRQTEPEIYSGISTSEDLSAAALRNLATVLGLTQQLGNSSGSQVNLSQLKDLEGKTGDIALTVRATTDNLEEFLRRVDTGQQVDFADLSLPSDRIVASSEILLNILGDVTQIRMQETDVEFHSRLLAIQRQLQDSSSSLSSSSGIIDNLKNRPSDEVNEHMQAAAAASQEGRDNLDIALFRFNELSDAAASTGGAPPSDLAILGTSFLNLSRNLETISLELQQVQQIETIPGVLAEVTSVSTEANNAFTITGDLAGQMELLSQPTGAVATIYTQLIDSQRQLQLGRLLFEDDNVRILTPPIAAQRVTDGGNITNTGVGVVAGTLLGLIIVFGMEYASNRIRSQEDVRGSLGISLFGAVPKAAGSWNPHPQVMPEAEASLFSESIRMIRTSIQIGFGGGSSKVLLITSPKGSEGKTTIALNLARTMAMEPRRVLLIDGNLRNPEIASAFNIDNNIGISNSLSTNMDLLELITEVDGVHILPAGPSVSSPADVFGSPVFSNFLAKAREQYDAVIIDSPPVLGFAETMILAKIVDGVIFAYRANRTMSKDAVQAREVLESAGIPILGAVLNMAGRNDIGVVFEGRNKPGLRIPKLRKMSFRKS